MATFVTVYLLAVCNQELVGVFTEILKKLRKLMILTLCSLWLYIVVFLFKSWQH